ncbi:chord-domain-containing protein [Piedraia hortae CBS 480.64]|uniref:Chord-domain-containing protein n=1 Tax=Piedraia hortae CBS 480.64 TaxID=1314780 RepID=A0A6A7BXL3_9PEZI|nr:chord-domain-containing protein [Piedraia hortae CBS 480.64]
MAQKCVHIGCGKTFANSEEECIYHPGPPVFHEGHKGWKCCKPRVLTFDEFMNIAPCTVGKHSTVDDSPAQEAKPSTEDVDAKIEVAQEQLQQVPIGRQPIATAPLAEPKPAPADEDEEDDANAPVPSGATCKRRGCEAKYEGNVSRVGEKCVHHPGHAIFHEGSKGWTCCKRRVLEFDEFLKIAGCKTKNAHLFVGKQQSADVEESLRDVRTDFYQTATTVIASFYIKKIDKERSTIEFRDEQNVALDLHTDDRKSYCTVMTTYRPIDPEKSSATIMGTKMELTLTKATGGGWPVLRADDAHTGEIIQAGRAGTMS